LSIRKQLGLSIRKQLGLSIRKQLGLCIRKQLGLFIRRNTVGYVLKGGKKPKVILYGAEGLGGVSEAENIKPRTMKVKSGTRK
jgi:hypothetical protein